MPTIQGWIERVTYQNEANGYTIAKLREDERQVVTTIVGFLPSIRPGEHLRVYGDWTYHNEYGVQFVAEKVEPAVPGTVAGIERFLGSGLIKGVGPKTARRLVEVFGLDTLTVIEKEPHRLEEVDGIGQKMAERIVHGLKEHKELQEVMVFLQGYGISPSLAMRIYRQYGEHTVEVVRNNPYQLAEDLYGVGFKTADVIARQLGTGTDSPERVRVGIKFVLGRAAEEGHVCLPWSRLVEQAGDLLGVDRMILDQAVHDLEDRNEIVLERQVRDEPYIYLASLFHAEIGAAKRLQAFLRVRTEALLPESLEAVIRQTEAENGMSLAPQQREAARGIATHNVLVITGGPGTGKTTVVRVLLGVLEKLGRRVVLAAPTGRAAKRLTESTGRPAKTIHRLLEFSFSEGQGVHFQRNQDHPLDGDAFIFDESSMIDLPVFYHLVKAIPPSSKIVFVGDVDQLPSVGVGSVLVDLIRSGVVPVVRLTQVFRQAGASLIVHNAHRINQGLMPVKGGRDRDFFFIERDRPEHMLEEIIRLCRDRLPAYLGVEPIEDIQVLSPMRKGRFGTDILNPRLQEALNPADPSRHELHASGRVFRVGDKVMQVRNDYQKEVYNGDIGRITAVDDEEGRVVVSFADPLEDRLVTYTVPELDDLQHAYAITVHKSQGSEYPAVVVPLMMEHYILLQRNLLYTAVTRARRLVVLIGSRAALERAVRHDPGAARYSFFTERLQFLASGSILHPDQ
jgi:exodeoxyribonuclease V alpha subunit